MTPKYFSFGDLRVFSYIQVNTKLYPHARATYGHRFLQNHWLSYLTKFLLASVTRRFRNTLGGRQHYSRL